MAYGYYTAVTIQSSKVEANHSNFPNHGSYQGDLPDRRDSQDGNGYANGEIVGAVSYRFDPNTTPKYVMSADSRGA